MERTYNIAGMTCSGCAQAVRNLLSNVAGVDKVKVDLEKKQAVVEMAEPVETEMLREALQNSPYRVTTIENE